MSRSFVADHFYFTFFFISLAGARAAPSNSRAKTKGNNGVGVDRVSISAAGDLTLRTCFSNLAIGVVRGKFLVSHEGRRA